MTLPEGAVVLSRLLQFGAAAILGGASLFFLYGAPSARQARWPARLVAVATLAGAVGVLGWLGAQTAQIGDSPADARDLGKVWSVAVETSFGRVGLLRFGAFVAGGLLASTRPTRHAGWLALVTLGAVATASFAWTGHGAKDDGVGGVLHVTADVLHLLSASVWIGALVPLLMLIAIAARGHAPDDGAQALLGLQRFSAIGVGVVAVLVVTGLLNSWFLIGPGRVGKIFTDPYGRLLLAKLLLFATMLGLAALNRFRHSPQLEHTGAPPATAFQPVLRSVAVETSLAIAVLFLVSWLGTLSPPIDM